jgi:hypothetical protein
MSVEAIRLMSARLQVTSAKAKNELGVTFRPFASTLADTVSWARTILQEKNSRSALVLSESSEAASLNCRLSNY